MKSLQERMLHEMQRRNYSVRTIDSYQSCLNSLSNYYQLPWDEIDLEQIKAYLHHYIVERNCSSSFTNQTISAVKILHSDVLKIGWNKLDIKRPKRPKLLPVVLSKQEALSIVHALENIKHKAILMIGYSAGLRIGEVINLKAEHIDSKRMQIRIVGGKGKKDRNTILSKTTLEVLRQYYKAYQPKQWLFEGWGPKGSRYSTTSIIKVLHKACRIAGVNKKITFHTLRHSFATHLLEQGTSIYVIQRLLGHSHISTSSMYVHVPQHINIVLIHV